MGGVVSNDVEMDFKFKHTCHPLSSAGEQLSRSPEFSEYANNEQNF